MRVLCEARQYAASFNINGGTHLVLVSRSSPHVPGQTITPKNGRVHIPLKVDPSNPDWTDLDISDDTQLALSVHTSQISSGSNGAFIHHRYLCDGESFHCPGSGYAPDRHLFVHGARDLDPIVCECPPYCHLTCSDIPVKLNTYPPPSSCSLMQARTRKTAANPSGAARRTAA